MINLHFEPLKFSLYDIDKKELILKATKIEIEKLTGFTRIQIEKWATNCTRISGRNKYCLRLNKNITIRRR